MEIEQPISQFKKTPSVRIVPSTGLLITSRKEEDFRSTFKGKTSNFAEITSRIASNSYQILDSIFGYSSYLLMNFASDYCYPYLQKVFQLIESRGYSKGYFVNETRYNDTPFLYRVDISSVCSKNLTDGRIVEKVISHGVSRDPEEAFSKSIGEFLERYFLLLYRKRNLLRSSSAMLKRKKFLTPDLSLLAGFSEEQKKEDPKKRFNEESILYWEKAKRWTTGEEVYLPAQFIYWNYQRDELEPLLCENNTNGAGGFFSLEGTILSGLYELIQRDSFFIYWLNRQTPKKINPHTVPNENFQKILEESERYGFEIHCLNITADIGIPVFAVVISDPSLRGPRYCLGAGCQADPAKALCRALEEAWSIYYWMRPMPSFHPVLKKDYQPFKDDSIYQEERLKLWANPEMAEYFDFFVSGREETFSEIIFDYPKSFNSAKEELNFLTKKIEKFGPGYEVYYFQVRNSLLSEVGYCAVQVVVPQLTPLYLKETNAPLGSLRLKEAPKRMGFEPAKDWNPWPHPFP